MSDANGIERRDFLKVLGAAGAGAATLGCSSEADRLIPYVVPHEEIVPGLATWYRTTCRECPAGCGMSVRTREGRAVKAEGNPLSPISHGALCPRGQASLHGLYNPDRVPQALAADGDSWARLTWDEAEQRLADALAQARGSAVFLTHGETGAMDRLLDDWCAAFGVERVRFDTFGMEPIRAAHRMLYGVDAVPVHDFAAAEVVLSFGADFMETWLSPVDYAHGFVEGHAYQGGRRGRFIAVSPHQSLTALNADDWLAVVPGTEHLVALAVAKLVAEANGSAGDAASLLDTVDVERVAQTAGINAGDIAAAAGAMAERPSLAVGPGVASQHRSATAVAAAVALLNRVAGNVGRSVHLDRREHVDGASYAELSELMDRLGSGDVQALLVRGPNPLHSVPLDGAREALAQVAFKASFASFLDETSAAADLLLPDHHFLESWGDHSPRTGVRSLVQPVMTPVFQTKQTGDVLLSVASRAGVSLPTQATTFYDYLRERWRDEVYPAAGGGEPFDAFWTSALQAGVITSDEAEPVPALRAGALDAIATGPADFDGEGEYYLVVYPSHRFYDGRMANRPWLQELPDPVSKITWGSWVEIHPGTADELGLDTGHLVEVETAHATVELPVWRHPGVRPDTIAVQLGQGHEGLGRWARDRGVNAAHLVGAEAEPDSGAVVWAQTTADVRPTGRWELLPIATAQDSESGRHVVAEVSLDEAIDADAAAFSAVTGAVPVAAESEEHAAEAGGHEAEVHPLEAEAEQLQASGGFAPAHVETGPQDYPPPGTYYGEYTPEQPRWGLAVDLDRCIGCSACMTACQAENNLPIVGPELVAQGRIVTWIRVERYFEYDDDELHGTKFLPMMCQQCGSAPCEPVCPVFASYHTPDGLNAQVYNRCVGTRYCANNCPYKVRYFNYYNYEWPEPLNWQLNPDVTVREKGVMEKCTFCVQRIREKEHDARLGGRTLADGEIVPACAQTCPGEAIVFGNVKDPESRVARVASSGRGFRVFEELNTQSAVTYLKPVVEREA